MAQMRGHASFWSEVEPASLNNGLVARPDILWPDAEPALVNNGLDAGPVSVCVSL